MPVKLLIALMLTLTCVISLHCVDARTLHKSDDITDDDDVTSRVAVVKRSVSEGRGRPVALSVPIMARRSRGQLTRADLVDAWDLLNNDDHSKLSSLLTDAILLEHLRHGRPTGHLRHEVWTSPYDQLEDEQLMRNVEAAEGREDGGLAESGLPMKRALGHLRSPRELHPVYLGLGQNAASAALDTYASLLADEKRRESLEQQQQSSANPVRFIGKR